MNIIHFSTFDSSKRSAHPTTNETIDGILKSIELLHPYKFGEKWSPAYKYVQSENAHVNTAMLRRCLKIMVKKGLVEPIDQNWKKESLEAYIEKCDWNTEVALTKFGDKVRENGGWLERLNWHRKLRLFGITSFIAAIGASSGLYAVHQGSRTSTLERQLQIELQLKDSLLQKTSDLTDLLKTKDVLLRHNLLKIDSLKSSILTLSKSGRKKS